MSSPASVSAEAETPGGGFSRGSERAGLITAEMPVAEAFSLLAAVAAEEASRRVRQLDAKTDPEVLHKLRVALRRMRSLWWAYEPLLDRKDAEFQRGEFKSLASNAGKTRDWDVLRDLLLAGESMQYSFTSLLGAVDERRADALSFSRTAIGNAGVERILESALVGARYQLDSRAISPTLPEFAQDRVDSAGKTLKKRVRRAVSHRDSGYAVLHEVRISGKRLRYLLEFFSPVLEGSHQATIERLTLVQDELGKLNDIVTSETLLREYSPQLGESTVIKEAARYLEDQKKHHMRTAQEILRATW